MDDDDDDNELQAICDNSICKQWCRSRDGTRAGTIKEVLHFFRSTALNFSPRKFFSHVRKFSSQNTKFVEFGGKVKILRPVISSVENLQLSLRKLHFSPPPPPTTPLPTEVA